MTLELVIGAVVLALSGIGSHAFHSWLKVRSQEQSARLQIAKEEGGQVASLGRRLEEQAKDAERFKSEVKTFMANVRAR